MQESIARLVSELEKLSLVEDKIAKISAHLSSETGTLLVEDGKQRQVQLTSTESAIYWASVEQFGEPKSARTEDGYVQNLPLLLEWYFQRKYNLGLRYHTEVTKAGLFQYMGRD